MIVNNTHSCSLLFVFVLTECLDSTVFLHSVFHHGPMAVIFQEYAHRDTVEDLLRLRAIYCFHSYLKSYSLPSPLSLWDKICVMYCNLVSVLADVQFCFLIGGCDAYLAFEGT